MDTQTDIPTVSENDCTFIRTIQVLRFSDLKAAGIVKGLERSLLLDQAVPIPAGIFARHPQPRMAGR